MTEKDIIDLIERDEWMMNVLRLAEKVQLKNWVIGAGFVRNKVWDHLHGFERDQVDTNDIDLVYFDPEGNSQSADERLSQQLERATGLKWEVVNEVYAHSWNDLPPYQSIEDALSQWPETATAIGVRLVEGKLILVAPYGIDDLVNLIVRPSPKLPGGEAIARKRMEQKKWLDKWPKVRWYV